MRIKNNTAILIAVIVISLPVLGRAQTFTIPELATTSRDKVVDMLVRGEETPLPLAELSATADIVVDARLVSPRSYLSEDKTKIYTDYEIVPSRVLRSQIGDILTSQKPGLRAPLRLTVLGGEITLEGRTIRATDGTRKFIKSGGRYLVFASRSKQDDHTFVAIGGAAGLFEVQDDGHVGPLLKTSKSNPDIEGVSFDDIVRKVESVPRR
jgi:hypothetical protein